MTSWNWCTSECRRNPVVGVQGDLRDAGRRRETHRVGSSGAVTSGYEKSCRKNKNCGEVPLNKLPAEVRKFTRLALRFPSLCTTMWPIICNTLIRRTTGLRRLPRTCHALKGEVLNCLPCGKCHGTRPELTVGEVTCKF